mmetsp:Transcript_27204/g.84460  ORF Transcript_27204/g.84460 Transcript_27204/m.84460 type:complete len:297 (+) Transcript_27204:883-1773(+)
MRAQRLQLAGRDELRALELLQGEEGLAAVLAAGLDVHQGMRKVQVAHQVALQLPGLVTLDVGRHHDGRVLRAADDDADEPPHLPPAAVHGAHHGREREDEEDPCEVEEQCKTTQRLLEALPPLARHGVHDAHEERREGRVGELWPQDATETAAQEAPAEEREEDPVAAEDVAHAHPQRQRPLALAPRLCEVGVPVVDGVVRVELLRLPSHQRLCPRMPRRGGHAPHWQGKRGAILRHGRAPNAFAAGPGRRRAQTSKTAAHCVASMDLISRCSGPFTPSPQTPRVPTFFRVFASGQ